MADLIKGSAASNPTYDFFAAFKQLFKESVEYK